MHLRLLICALIAIISLASVLGDEANATSEASITENTDSAETANESDEETTEEVADEAVKEDDTVKVPTGTEEFIRNRTAPPDHLLERNNLLHDHPFYVSLRRPINYHFCGGALLSATFALTASRCIPTPFDPNISVVLRASPATWCSWSTVMAAYRDDDVALLHLRTPASTGRFAQLPPPTRPCADHQHLVLSWTSSPTAGGRLGADACRYDNGAPLVCDGVVLGVLSMGGRCDGDEVVGVFAKVDRRVGFLRRVLEGGGRQVDGRSERGGGGVFRGSVVSVVFVSAWPLLLLDGIVD